MHISKISILTLAILIFASINPHDVQAATYQPPKVYADGIVPVLHIKRESPVPLPNIERQPIAEKSVYVAPVAVTEPPQTYTPVTKDNPLKRGVVSGNTYAKCNCTFYAKNKRPDLPNSLGNANSWVSKASAQGIPTGTTPKVGAVGMFKSYMHVAYVEEVRGNQVLISEWNYSGLCVKTTRLVPASDLLYIY